MLEIWCNYCLIKDIEKILNLCQTDKILNLSMSYYQPHVFIIGALGSIALISTCHLPASVRRVWAPSSVRRARADFKSILLLFLVHASDVQSLKPSACTLRYKHSHLNILQGKMRRSVRDYHTGGMLVPRMSCYSPAGSNSIPINQGELIISLSTIGYIVPVTKNTISVVT